MTIETNWISICDQSPENGRRVYLNRDGKQIPVIVVGHRYKEHEYGYHKDFFQGDLWRYIEDPIEIKFDNPKDTIGSTKVPFSTIPGTVLAEMAVSLGEGARKYGKHNWRAAEVRASIYYDALIRHMISWYEGEDRDPDSGLSHITKAITSLVVLRDAMINNKFIDDRPIPATNNPVVEANEAYKKVCEKHADCGCHYDLHSIRERK